MNTIKTTLFITSIFFLFGCMQPREWVGAPNNQTTVDDIKAAKTACDYDNKAKRIDAYISTSASYLVAGNDYGRAKAAEATSNAKKIGDEINQCMGEHGFTTQPSKRLSY